MATSFQFGNKLITEPGAFSQIKSGIKNPARALSFGNVLIIDTGAGANFGIGSGVAGTLAKNKDAISRFVDIGEFRDAVRGGLFFRLAEPLFQPDGFTIPGISRLSFIKAASTVPAEIKYVFVGGGSNGGTLEIQVRNEGPVGNGVEGDQTLATAPFTVTVPGSASDTIEVKVDESGGPFSLGIYTVQGGDGVNQVAAGIAAAITAGTTGYTAIAVAAIVTITARNPKGLKQATEANSFIPSIVTTGTVATSGLPGTFGGGVDGTKVTRGVAGIMKAGPTSAPTPDKFIIEFVAGTFRGLDQDNEPFDNIAEIDTDIEFLFTTQEFTTFDELISALENSAKFNRLFKIKTKTKTGDGSIDDADLITNAGNNKAADGTETYSAAKLDEALVAVTDEDYTFVLADNFGTDAVIGGKSANNVKIFTHILTKAKFQKYIVIGGGNDENEFDTVSGSTGIAAFYDNARAIIVHAGSKILKRDGVSFKEHLSIFKTAGVLGRITGLEPQVPVTFKSIRMDGDRHEMTENERVLALEKGVLHTKFDDEFIAFVVNQGINSLQGIKNDFLVNEDGTSHDIAVERIAAQLNKIIIVNAKQRLLAKEDGVNRNVLSPLTVQTFVVDLLIGLTATDILDNLILSFRNVVVTIEQDAFKITYGFVPNFPVNKLFFTGFMLDVNL